MGRAVPGIMDDRVFASVPAPMLSCTGDATRMIHPHIMSLMGYTNVNTAIQNIKGYCPAAWYRYFEQRVDGMGPEFGLTSQFDWCEHGRDFACVMRPDITPLLFYALFFHAKHYSHQKNQQVRHRCGVNVRAKQQKKN